MTTPPFLPLRRFLREDTKERVLVVEVRPKRKGKPWLLFFTFQPNGRVIERRRLEEFAPQWHELPDLALSALHSTAVRVTLPARTSPTRALGAVENDAAPGLSVAELTHELDAARRALEIA